MIGSMKFKKKTRLTDNLFKLNYSEKAEGYFITSKITKELESSRPEKKSYGCKPRNKCDLGCV